MTERITLSFPRYDAHADAVVVVQQPFDLKLGIEQVWIAVLDVGGFGRLVLEDCGRRDPFGNRVFESSASAVKH